MNLNPTCYPNERPAPNATVEGAPAALPPGHRPLEVLTAAYVAIGLSATQAAASARADFDCIFDGEEPSS